MVPFPSRENTYMEEIDAPTPITPQQRWLNQFAESAEAQTKERERRYHFHKTYGRGTLF